MEIKMATVQIGVKIEEKVKDRIDRLVELGRYRHISDFIHRAIAAELDREGQTPEEYQRKLTMQAIESEAGIALVKKILDKELLRRAVGDIDPNRSD